MLLQYIEFIGYLGMKRVSRHWVPRMLTDEENQNLVDVCTDLLCRLQTQPEIFLDRIVTQDETWVHHFDPDTKRQSMAGNTPVLTLLKNSRSSHLPEKSGLLFWDCNCVMMTDYLSKGFTVTSAYYADELH